MRSTMLADVNSLSPTVQSGDDEELKMSPLGELFTADWKMRLLRAGKVWKTSIGGITAGSAITQITGGGAGTTMDMEQPEIIVGVPSGYFLIPIECTCMVTADLDAPDDFCEILLILDRTNNAPSTATATANTPVNLLDGGGAFPGTAWTAVTADITDPVYDELLDYERLEVTAAVLNGTASNEEDAILTQLKMHYVPSIPSIGAGPCSIVLMFDGSVATTGIACLTYAAVPSTWFPTS